LHFMGLTLWEGGRTFFQTEVSLDTSSLKGFLRTHGFENLINSGWKSSSVSRSVHGLRPAACWSRSALQQQGSPFAAQTMRERWEIRFCLPKSMCLDCTGGEHRDHMTVPLRDVVEQHKAVLKTQLDAIRSRLPQLTAAIELVSEISRQLNERKTDAVTEINSTFEELERVLHQRKTAFITDLENICSTKQKGKEHIQSSCSFTEQALSHGNATEKQMSERVTALARHDFPEKPHQNAHLDCQDGELVRTGYAVLKAEILSADGNRAAETEIMDNKNGTYEVGYTLRSEGEYSFCLLLYGQPICGSPFRLRAVKPSDVPQSPDDVKRRVKSPSGTGGHIRQKAMRRPSSMYSTTKKKENPIEDELIYRNCLPSGSRGREKGEFTNLQGISASSNGRVVVADSNNQCIQVFSNDGQFKMRFGVRGRSPGQLQRPTGVTVDMNGDIVVADYDNRWVSIFSSDGKFKVLSTLGPLSRLEGLLTLASIAALSAQGGPSEEAVGSGVQSGRRLMGPKGVAVDKNGHIITVDNKACCVFIFQSNGKLVTKFGGRGTSDRQFAGEEGP
ncbi:hypothetical protein XENOCAPTIV_022121, partial [Xenoophorus captivus]